MAGAAKRPRCGPPAPALPAFLRWCAQAGVELSAKVGVSREGTAGAYGLLARESLEAGEELFSVPRTALLAPQTSALAPLLREEAASLQSASGWAPLLVALLHESTASDSRWAPYFALWPRLAHLDPPMFWGPEERARLLRGTGVLEAVGKDLADTEREYSSIILPFLEAHPDLFSPKVHTLELYRRLVAFVMAYSFQEPLNEEDEEEEPNPPVMVPLADLLNHVASHNANLEYSAVSKSFPASSPLSRARGGFASRRPAFQGGLEGRLRLLDPGREPPPPSPPPGASRCRPVQLSPWEKRRRRPSRDSRLQMDRAKLFCHSRPQESLKMVTTRPVRKGQEIFNTYGEMANWQLLHMYGFAEAFPGNTNDAADIQMSTLLKAALHATDTDTEEKLVLDQWDFLCRQEMVGEEGAFVIGWERVFTEEELSVALQVLTMSAEEFKELKGQEAKGGGRGTAGWIRSVTQIPGLSAAQRRLLSDATVLTLKAFSCGLEEEETVLGDPQAYSELSRREQFALQVRYGQKKILHQLLELAK